MITAATLTKLMDRMVSQGLVYRRADDRDRRRVLAYLADLLTGTAVTPTSPLPG
jgi:DNA-binding MarR family transcriptional regulator